MAGLVVATLMLFNTWWECFESYGELVLFCEMDMKSINKIMLYCFPEMKRQQSFTTEIGR